MKNLKFLFALPSSHSDLEWLVEGWKERFLTPRRASKQWLSSSLSLERSESLIGSVEKTPVGS